MDEMVLQAQLVLTVNQAQPVNQVLMVQTLTV
jgi:hypothetical protein